MRTPLFQTAMVLLALGGTASAQFSAALGSGEWSPRSAGQPSSRGPGHPESGTFGYSDCDSENSLGLTNGGQIAWFQGFDTYCSDRITSVSVANGTTSGAGAPAGNAGAVYVYDDPGGDFTDPTDLGAPVDSRSWITTSPNTDIKEHTSVSAQVGGGFWLAAHMTQAAGEFPAAFDTDNLSNGTSWVSGSNTVFDPTDPGGGIGFFEMSALGFDSVWLISACACASNFVQSYCTAKSGLVCGTPWMIFCGVPDTSQTSGFRISAASARANRSGQMLYGCAGRAAIPFEGGLLCVNPAPLRRVPPVNSGGTAGSCNGAFDVDWNTFASGNGGGNPDPCVTLLGQQINAQWWGRDSVATGSFLSNGLEFKVR